MLPSNASIGRVTPSPNDVWCNGSTADFDSVSCGSSPHISTNIRYGVINSKLGIVQPDESGA